MSQRLLYLSVVVVVLGCVGREADADTRLTTGVAYTEVTYSESGDDLNHDATNYDTANHDTTIYDVWVPLTLAFSTPSYSVSVGTWYLLDSDLQPDSGLGDLSLTGRLYDVIYFTGWRTGVDISARFKLPSANAGLGTGEFDSEIGFSIYHLRDAITWHGGLDYLMAGDTSNINYADEVTISAGFTMSLASQLDVGVFIDMNRNSITQNTSSDGSLFFQLPISDDIQLRPYIAGSFSGDDIHRDVGVFIDLSL